MVSQSAGDAVSHAYRLSALRLSVPLSVMLTVPVRSIGLPGGFISIDSDRDAPFCLNETDERSTRTSSITVTVTLTVRWPGEDAGA